MIFKDKDGELRLVDGTGGTGPYYMELLFTNADLSFPIARSRPEEILNLDRGNIDSNMSYSEGPDDPILEPLPITFSARLDNSVNTTYLVDWLSSVTPVVINDKPLVTTKATSSVTTVGSTTVSTKAFADDQKTAYNIEILWDTTGTDLGYKITEVYFPPDQQTITESTDNVTINMNGMIYGQITRATAFTSGTSIQR